MFYLPVCYVPAMLIEKLYSGPQALDRRGRAICRFTVIHQTIVTYTLTNMRIVLRKQNDRILSKLSKLSKIILPKCEKKLYNSVTGCRYC